MLRVGTGGMIEIRMKQDLETRPEQRALALGVISIDIVHTLLPCVPRQWGQAEAGIGAALEIGQRLHADACALLLLPQLRSHVLDPPRGVDTVRERRNDS